jgi:hypothetical protein
MLSRALAGSTGERVLYLAGVDQILGRLSTGRPPADGRPPVPVEGPKRLKLA